MNRETNDDYELIAKHCPCCESLIMARVEIVSTGEIIYSDYRCSGCKWISPRE